MEVFNFDDVVFKKKEKSLKQRSACMPTWDRDTFRELICGPSGCGKTNILLNMLLTGLSFDDIHLFCLKTDEPYYEFLNEYFEDVDEKLNKRLAKKGKPPHQTLYMYDNLDEFPEVNELDPKLHHIIIFDDVLGEKDLSKVINYAIASRKSKCGMFILTQSFYAVPKMIRQQCNIFDIFGFPSQREINMIRQDVCPYVTNDVWKKMFSICRNTDRGFLRINCKTNDPKKRFTCKFNTPLHIEESIL